MNETHPVEDIYGASLQSKWHSFHFEVLRNEKGLWLQLVETRPRGQRQTIVVESGSVEAYHRELLKAVSAVRGAMGDSGACCATPDPAHSASAVRPRSYAAWEAEEDRTVQFLYRAGASVAEMASALQREAGAVRSRIRKLQCKEVEQ